MRVAAPFDYGTDVKVSLGDAFELRVTGCYSVIRGGRAFSCVWNLIFDCGLRCLEAFEICSPLVVLI